MAAIMNADPSVNARNLYSSAGAADSKWCAIYTDVEIFCLDAKRPPMRHVASTPTPKGSITKEHMLYQWVTRQKKNYCITGPTHSKRLLKIPMLWTLWTQLVARFPTYFNSPLPVSDAILRRPMRMQIVGEPGECTQIKGGTRIKCTLTGLIEPNERDHIDPGVMRALCGNDYYECLPSNHPSN